jgi:hypothetical protein
MSINSNPYFIGGGVLGIGSVDLALEQALHVPAVFVERRAHSETSSTIPRKMKLPDIHLAHQ